MTTVFGDVRMETGPGHVTTVTISRPPSNFFDADLIESLAAAYEACDTDPGRRAIVLRSEGTHFCAGAQFRVGAALARAHELATELAAAAPLAVRAIRATMRDGLAAAVGTATGHELREQDRLRQTADWREGIRASSDRREPRFTGR